MVPFITLAPKSLLCADGAIKNLLTNSHVFHAVDCCKTEESVSYTDSLTLRLIVFKVLYSRNWVVYFVKTWTVYIKQIVVKLV